MGQKGTSRRDVDADTTLLAAGSTRRPLLVGPHARVEAGSVQAYLKHRTVEIQRGEELASACEKRLTMNDQLGIGGANQLEIIDGG
jgi:hypothetical protein